MDLEYTLMREIKNYTENNEVLRKELKHRTKNQLLKVICYFNTTFSSVEFQNFSHCTEKLIIECLCKYIKYEGDGIYSIDRISTLNDKPLKRIINVAKCTEYGLLFV